MCISKEIMDELLKGVERPEDLLCDAGLMKELKIKLMERMLGAELTAHLGYEEGEDAPAGQANDQGSPLVHQPEASDLECFKQKLSDMEGFLSSNSQSRQASLTIGHGNPAWTSHIDK